MIKDTRLDLNEKKEEDDNVVPFRLLPGGKTPPSGNWLLDLPIGARFTVQSKSDFKNFMCLDLELVNKTSRTAVLWDLASGNPLGGNGRVVANRFVNLFDYVETLPVLFPQEEETTENTNGSGSRTDKLES